ncbi:MAG: phospholipase D-like domain-containing protein [Isosphaeraceae bacterium]
MARARGWSCEALEGLEGRLLLSGAGVATRSAEVRAAAQARLPAPGLFIEPQAGRTPILRAIASARSQIRVGICNLSDPQVGDALIAAVSRGVRVRIIVDRADYLAKPPEQAEVARLLAAGVQVRLSNPVFPQSFPKYLLIDDRRAVVMTLCLVPLTFVNTREYGVVLADRGIIGGIGSVFATDWANAAPPGRPTPPYNPTPSINDPRLIVAPTNAIDRLSALITGARGSLDLTSEIVDDPFLEGQLVAAVGRGVRVRLIAPQSARAGNDNLPSLLRLQAAGVQVHVTDVTDPPPGAIPHMHAKSIVADGRVAYLGSIDLDTTQTARDRELGLVLRDRSVVVPMRAQFRRDWATTLALVAPPS